MAIRLTGRGDDGFNDLNAGRVNEVRAYWEALRKDARLPRRADIDPRGIANALDQTFLIDRVAPGLARFRIAGMVFTELLGMDVRGMPISALFSGTARAELQMVLERMFHTPAITTLMVTADRGFGKSRILARVEILPLLDHQDNCTLALGCIELADKPIRLGHLFSIVDVKSVAIGGLATNPPDHGADSAAPAQGISPLRLGKSAPARAQDAFENLHLPKIVPPSTERTAPVQRTGVPYLRLVK